MHVGVLTEDVFFGRMAPSRQVLLVPSSCLPPQQASELCPLSPWMGCLLGGKWEGLGTRFMDLGLRKRRVRMIRSWELEERR